MESIKELTMQKGKRPKSPTRYPKRMPTYVVAFAVQETLDDPQKLQQITNKRSENSTPSISPTDSNNSAKTFIISPTDQLPSIRDIPTLSEVKIDILDDNQCGDVVEKKSPQINSFVVIDNRNAHGGQPEILFNAPKHTRRYKDSNRFTSKKPRKSKRVINFKNVHFKYKKPKNSITRRLEKYYEKTKSNTPNSEQIQNQIYCNVLSKVVSRSRVLRKVLAKENLLADSDRISTLDGVSIFDYDNDSMNSSPSTRKSFISYTSQKTLVKINSASSRNEDFNGIKTANSAITVASDRQSPYKSDIINVLAVAYNGSKTNTNRTAASSHEKLMHKENLTSSETFLPNNATELTSRPPSDEPNYKIDYDALTLTPMNLNENVQNSENEDVKSILGVRSEDDTFDISQASSDFIKSSMVSDCTLTFNSETMLTNENVQSSCPNADEFADNFSNKTTLLDKVKFLGFYPTKTPSVGSNANLCCDLNDLLVSDSNNMTNSFPITSNNITDDHPTDTQKSVLRKPIDLNNMNYLQTNISLPNDITIKAKLKEVEEARRSCPDSIKNKYPTDLAEMWERLTIVLDFAVKRLEDTLADKIVKEIRESLATLNQPECKTQTVEIQRVETTLEPVTCNRPIPTMLHKEIFVKEDHLKRDVDVCVQCDLVQVQVIDQLMLKLSAEKPIPSSAEALKVLQPPELLKDRFEILKPPVELSKESASVEAGKVDTATVSTATTALSSTSGLYRFKRLIAIPATFLRENTLVISSVPTFFIVMFCIYGVIMLILNP